MPAYYPYQIYQPVPQQAQQMQQIPQMQQTQQTMQIQNGGFLPVPSEDVARNYPVAPGNSITFKNENAPYVYTKTMGFSQLDRPIFEKFKLVREDDTPVATQETNKEPETNNLMNESIDNIKGEIEAIWGEINAIKKSTKKPVSKADKNGDD